MRAFGNGGSTGFFEDLPAMVIVILTFVLFIGLATNIFNTTTKSRDFQNFAQEVNNFIEALRAYDGLTHSGIVGLFDAHKVRSLSAENISRDLKPDYNFTIEIIDISGYPFNCSRKITNGIWYPEKWLEMGRSVGYTSVAIWVSDEEIHAAKMVVTIWR